MRAKTKPAAALSELQAGEKIKHPVYGVLKFTELLGDLAAFTNDEGNTVVIQDRGIKYRLL